MNIAIIGAGFTGIAAAHELRKFGHTITFFEANSYPGGLAAGFQEKEWEWSLEHHYHHIFRSDKDIIELVKAMDLEELLFFSPVKTSTRYHGHQFRLDSPMSLLAAPELSLTAKLRTAAALAFLKLFPLSQPLDSMTAEQFIKSTMGKAAWKMLWEPLFIGKFGKYASTINAAWFWSRIHVRSSELGYFRGGFLQLAQAMVKKLETEGSTFKFETPVKTIKTDKKNNLIAITTTEGKTATFDQVLVTTPAEIFARMTSQLPTEYRNTITNLKSLAATTLVLELDTPFFADKTYWLNINEPNWPFLAVVEHSQFAGTHPYNDHTIVYVGKYLEKTDSQYDMNKEELLKLYQPFLDQLSPHFDKHIIRSFVFKTPFAQPIVEKNHRKQVPSVTTPFPNVYWCSMQHVYPFDRGTNYAVAFGRQAANIMMDSSV